MEQVIFTSEEYQWMKSMCEAREWIVFIEGKWMYRPYTKRYDNDNQEINDIVYFVLSRLLMGGGYYGEFEYRFVPEKNVYIINSLTNNTQ